MDTETRTFNLQFNMICAVPQLVGRADTQREHDAAYFNSFIMPFAKSELARQYAAKIIKARARK